MTVATFTQPDHSTQGGTTYKLAINNCIAVLERIGRRFAPRELSTPGMQVRVEAGALFVAGVLLEVAAQSTAVITAPTTNPRIDRVVIDQYTGAASVVTGTEAASPAAPDIPAGTLPVCRVALATSTTAITNALITDERVLLVFGGGAGSLARLEKTGAYQAVAADKGKEIACTGTFTLSFDDCASLAADFYCWVKLLGTGKLTLAADGTEKFFVPGGDPAGVNSFTVSTFDPGADLYGVDSLLVATDGADLHVLAVSCAPVRPGPAPPLVRVSGSVVKVAASADLPAGLALIGFPNPLNWAEKVGGGLTDGRYRRVTSDVSLDISAAGGRWGSYKDNTWYAAYALAADAATAFTLKAMPLLRFSSQGSQVITFRNHANSGDIGYGFTTDEFAGGKILILTGLDAGQVRTITANNNNDATGGTLTYSGAALSNIARPDWFVILPPGINFRWVRNFFHKLTTGNPDIDDFEQKGDWYTWKAAKSYDYRYLDPLAALFMKEGGALVFVGASSIYPTDAPSGVWACAYAAGAR